MIVHGLRGPPNVRNRIILGALDEKKALHHLLASTKSHEPSYMSWSSAWTCKHHSRCFEKHCTRFRRTSCDSLLWFYRNTWKHTAFCTNRQVKISSTARWVSCKGDIWIRHSKIIFPQDSWMECTSVCSQVYFHLWSQLTTKTLADTACSINTLAIARWVSDNAQWHLIIDIGFLLLTIVRCCKRKTYGKF